jgi:tRNA pseudouridine38-40 synthase
MARFKIYLEFEGTRFAGWQIQKNAKTLQGEFFRVCEQVFNTKQFEFYGSGRTDGGVHAIEQVAHLDVDTDLKPIKIQHKLNDALPHDINILHVEKAHPKFHARHDAKARSYIYLISKRKSALGKQFVWWIKDELNVENMKKAAHELAGFKDFSSFTDDTSDEKSTLVKLDFIDIYEFGDTIIIHTLGSHFLWKMVRRMTGILVEVGRGNLKPSDIQRILKDPSYPVAKFTAPPSGLFLEHVYYEGEEILRGEESFKLPFSVI